MMYSELIRLALWCLLLTFAEAGRMHERSRRKGFTESLVRDLQYRGEYQSKNRTHFRFLNNETESTATSTPTPTSPAHCVQGIECTRYPTFLSMSANCTRVLFPLI